MLISNQGNILARLLFISRSFYICIAKFDKMKQLFFLFSFCIALTMSAQDVTWHTDFEQAKMVSKESGKPILMYFTGSDWCGPCKMLKKDFWQNSEFLNQANDFVLLEVDIPFREDILTPEQFEKNKKLQNKYNKDKSFPKVLALNASGRVYERISAYSMLRDTSMYFDFLDKARSIR